VPPTRDTGVSGLLPGVCLSLLLLGAAAGCGKPETAAARLEIHEPRASLLQETGAVYLTVVNRGAESDRLLRVETTAARAAETHESVEENGVVRMVARPEGFEVPAGGKLELAPAGKHVMLIEPRELQPAAGTIPLTLYFERAGAIEVQAAVSAMDGMDHGSMDHGGHATGTGEGAPPQ
jgi:periplasmic copper chaperone A